MAKEELESRCDLLSDGNGLQCNKRVRSDIDISCPEVEEEKTNEPIDDDDIGVRKRRKVHNAIDSDEDAD